MKSETVGEAGVPSGRAFWPMVVVFGCWVGFLLALAILRYRGH